MGGWIGAIVAVVALVAASGGGLLLRKRSGNFRELASESGKQRRELASESGKQRRELAGELRKAADPEQEALAGLGVTPGTLTLLQFSSAFCGPCRTTRVLCADVARLVPGVRHVEVDAESHLEAVRALDIWRTPTVLIVDAQRRISRRASGAPSRAQLLAAVEAAMYAQTGRS